MRSATFLTGFLGSILVSAFLILPPAFATKVLFVGGQPDAVQGADGEVLAILQEHYGAENITVLGANFASTEDAEGRDLVVLSSTPGSGSIRGKWLDFEGGLLNWEEALVDGRDGNFPFTGGKRPQSDQSEWIITEVAHYITEGYEAGASASIFDPTGRTWSFAGSSLAEAVLVLAKDPEDVGGTLAVVEKGGLLNNDVVSAGRRVMFGMTDDSPATFSTDGIALFKRALDWAAGNDAPPATDTDGDGMDDEYETANGLNPADAADRDTDLDGDGLTNFDEFELGTKPNAKDSDEDGLDDNIETNTGVWVSTSDTGTHPLRADTDEDGLLDGVETNTGTFTDSTNTGTNPHLIDTDGDGPNDGLEVTGNADPTDPSSVASALFGGAPFTTTHVFDTDTAIDSLGSAKSAIAGNEGDKITVQTPFIHFHDNADAPVLRELSRPYPLWDEAHVGSAAEGAGDHNNHAIFSTGNIFVKTPGFITFVCSSDDGFSLEIDGAEIGSKGNGARENTTMTVELTEGLHQVSFWHYEREGAAGVSLYVYRGTGQEPPELNGGDFELLQAVDPFIVTSADTDGDEMDDFAETFFFENLDRDGSGDFDEDGLDDRTELVLLTFPNNKDTDGDGLEDGPEVSEHSSDPTKADSDGDSLSDGREINELNTDPNMKDSDGDAFDDNIELALGYDPSTADNKPDAVVAVSSGAWDSPNTWSDGLAPTPGKNYVAVGTLTGKLTSRSGTFRGDSLTLVGPDMVLELGHDGDALVNLTLDNTSVSVIRNGSSLGGLLDIRGDVLVEVGGNSLTLNSKITGGGNLTFQGGNAIDVQGNVELNGEDTTFGGSLNIIGTDVTGQSEGSLGTGSILLANGGLVYGYDASNDLSRLKIRGENFRLALNGAIEIVDLVGVDSAGADIFSLTELGGPGPYTAASFLETVGLAQGATGAGTFTLIGNAADTDGDGLRDSFENEKLGGLDATADGDPDGDGLTNLAEQSSGTDPTVPDTVVAEKLPQLIAHYDFNEGSGTTINNAIGPNGTLVHAHDNAWVESGGVRGSGYLNFDNTAGNGADSQHILTGLVPADAGLLGDDAEYTMMAWTRYATTAPGGNDDDGMVFGQFGGNVLHHGARAGQYHMGHWGNDLTTGSVVVDEWHHVAWRYKDATLEIFVDGTSIGSDAKLGFQDPAEIIIGTTKGDEDRDFSGDLDDVRIYDGAISEAEIVAIASFKPRAGGSLAGLIGYWPEEYVTTSSDHKDLGVLPILTPDTGLTWSIWVNAEANAPNNVVLGNRFGNDGFDLFPRAWVKLTPAKFEWHHPTDGDDVTNEQTAIPTGIWSHNLIVQDRTTLTYYRDGKVIGTSELTGFPPNPLPLFLGGQPASDGTTTEGFSGTLKEVAIFGKALTLAEVTEVYARGVNDQSLGAVGVEPQPEPMASSLTNVGLSANGSLSFDLPNEATGEIEYSTDLLNWNVIATDAVGAFEDSDATRNAATKGFYRAKR